MDDVLIRDAVCADAEAIFHLNTVSMGYDYPAHKTRRALEQLLASGKDKILVAEQNSAVVGYLHLNDYDLLYSDHMKNIMGIAVDPDCRRMGIGRKLLEAGESWAREQGATGIRLVSGEKRTGAHKFYQALGYVSSKRQLNFKKSF